LPVKQQKLRQQLLRWFRQNGFGYLQNSVWITPDRLTELTAALDEFRDDVESLTVVESRCHAGYSDAALVSGAWDFEEINGRYATHLSQANGELQRRLPAAGGVAELRTRMRQERIAWTTAVGIDPLLPQALLPDGYRGRQAWEAHVSVMTRLSRGLAAELRRQ
jgi:DNA-binding transcriptional regulator PaaX